MILKTDSLAEPQTILMVRLIRSQGKCRDAERPIMDAAQPVGDYLDLVRILRSRVAEVNSTFENIDTLAGLSRSYTGKLLCDPPLKGMGIMSLFALLGALALRIKVEPDDEALAQLQARQSWTEMIRHGPRYRPARNGHNGPRGKRRRSRGRACA
jgi:hypothetical protein